MKTVNSYYSHIMRGIFRKTRNCLENLEFTTLKFTTFRNYYTYIAYLHSCLQLSMNVIITFCLWTWVNFIIQHIVATIAFGIHLRGHALPDMLSMEICPKSIKTQRYINMIMIERANGIFFFFLCGTLILTVN